jgi:sulfofructose kinase
VAPYVVCVGAATLDTIVLVDRHPGPDERVWASDFAVAGGGPAATAAVTLARLGVDAYFVGAAGDDEPGVAIRAGLAEEGVDVSEVRVVAGARSAQSVILVARDGGTRSISAFLGTLPALVLGERALELCREAAWVHVDHIGYAAVREVRRELRLSVDAGNPIERLELDGVALYSPTEPALHATFGKAQDALDAGAELVVVTRGAAGSVAYTRDGEVVEVPAPQVDVVSTLGAGDVFHGALLAQLVRDVPLRDALAGANECAALSCRGLDGRSAIPATVP